MKNLFIPILILAALLTGCQTTSHTFQSPGQHWQTETGQLQYSTAKRSIIGDCVVTCYNDSEFQLDFLAASGYPIMKLRQSADFAKAEVAYAHITWQGKTEHPPGKLRSWLGLREVFGRLAVQPVSEKHVNLESDKPGFWKADANLKDGRPLDVAVQFPQSREHFVFHFNQ